MRSGAGLRLYRPLITPVLRHKTDSRCAEPTIFLSHAAICKIPCQNGGTCVKPNQCQCPPGYRNISCGQREYTLPLLALSVVILLKIAMVSPGTHFMKSRESQCKIIEFQSKTDDFIGIFSWDPSIYSIRNYFWTCF